MSYRKASKTFPKTTIFDQVSGKVKPGAKYKIKPVIPLKVENAIAKQ